MPRPLLPVCCRIDLASLLFLLFPLLFLCLSLFLFLFLAVGYQLS